MIRTELAHWSKTGQSSTDGHTSETHLRDRCLTSVYAPHPFSTSQVFVSTQTTPTHVNNTVLSKFVQQAFSDLPSVLFVLFSPQVPAHLVSTVVSRDLFTHDEDRFITQHFLLHRRIERLSDGLSSMLYLDQPFITYHRLLTL